MLIGDEKLPYGKSKRTSDCIEASFEFWIDNHDAFFNDLTYFTQFSFSVVSLTLTVFI